MLRHSLNIVLAGLLLAPIIGLILYALSASSDAWAHLWATTLPQNLYYTGLLAVGVGVGTLIIGTTTAWAVVMYDFPARRLWQVGLFLPLVIPAYISAWLYQDAYSALATWPWRQWLAAHTGFALYGLSGAIFVMTLALAPYVYLAARVAFATETYHLIEAAHTLGMNRRQAFWRLGLPLAAPAVLAGLSLALMETLADYGTVALLGVPTFTNSLYRIWFGLGDPIGAAQLALLLLGCMVILLFMRHAGKPMGTARRHKPIERRKLSGWRGYGVSLLCALPCMGGFGVPLILLFWHLPAGLTSTNISLSLWDAFLPTLLLAGGSTALMVVVFLFLAVRCHSSPARWVHQLNHAATLGYALPGSVIAIGIMVTLAPLQQTGWFVFGTLAALVYAYHIRFSTVTFNALDAGLHQLPPHLNDAARSLGASASQVFWRVQLPLLRPTIAAAGLFTFVDIIKELPATLILRPFDMTPLAVRVFQLASDERLADAALPALLMVLISVPAALWLERRFTSTLRHR